MFSRNHNFIADKIKSINEKGRFNPAVLSPQQLDEELFQTARLINNGCYFNFIMHDYLRSALGLEYLLENFT